MTPGSTGASVIQFFTTLDLVIEFSTRSTSRKRRTPVEAHYKQDEYGRSYRLASLLAPGGRGPRYMYKGYEKNWRFTQDKMLELEAQGRVYYRDGQMPSRIYYLRRIARVTGPGRLVGCLRR